jgi:SAM-dependent methyltransferase
MSSSVQAQFEKHEVADYEKRRYRGLDQRLVHGREVSILKKFLKQAGGGSPNGQASSPLILDAPCGYGRFAGLILGQGFRLISSDLSFHMVKRAVERTGSPPAAAGIVSNLTRGIPLKGCAVTAVFSMRFFHHLHDREDRRTALREFGRIAAGFVILSYYQTNALHILQRTLRRAVKPNKRRISMIARREFVEDARAAGMEVVRIAPLFRGIHGQHIALLKKVP